MEEKKGKSLVKSSKKYLKKQVYGMEKIQLNFKSFKKELIEEEGDFQAASLPPNPEQPSAATPGATIRLLLLVHWFLRIF